MITQAQIKKLVTDKIEDTDQFMVSVEVKPGTFIYSSPLPDGGEAEANNSTDTTYDDGLLFSSDSDSEDEGTTTSSDDSGSSCGGIIGD